MKYVARALFWLFLFGLYCFAWAVYFLWELKPMKRKWKKVWKKATKESWVELSHRPYKDKVTEVLLEKSKARAELYENENDAIGKISVKTPFSYSRLVDVKKKFNIDDVTLNAWADAAVAKGIRIEVYADTYKR